MRTLPVRLLDLATALADHDIEPIESGSPVVPSLLDQEAEALAANEQEGNHDLAAILRLERRADTAREVRGGP